MHTAVRNSCSFPAEACASIFLPTLFRDIQALPCGADAWAWSRAAAVLFWLRGGTRVGVCGLAEGGTGIDMVTGEGGTGRETETGSVGDCKDPGKTGPG